MYLNPLARGTLHAKFDDVPDGPGGAGNPGTDASNSTGKEDTFAPTQALSSSDTLGEKRTTALPALERLQSDQVSREMRRKYVEYLVGKIAMGMSHPAEQPLVEQRRPLVELLS